MCLKHSNSMKLIFRSTHVSRSSKVGLKCSSLFTHVRLSTRSFFGLVFVSRDFELGTKVSYKESTVSPVQGCFIVVVFLSVVTGKWAVHWKSWLNRGTYLLIVWNEPRVWLFYKDRVCTNPGKSGNFIVQNSRLWKVLEIGIGPGICWKVLELQTSGYEIVSSVWSSS